MSSSAACCSALSPATPTGSQRRSASASTSAWGKAAFWCWFVGFYLAFMPLYVVGLMGMTRRMQHYDVPEWHPWLLVAAAGAVVILAGILLSGRAARREHPPSRGTARHDRRPVDGPVARMVDVVAAAGVQLRRSAPCRGAGRLLADEAARDRARDAGAGAGLSGYRDAEQQRDRLRLRVFRHLRRLRHDLADLVAGELSPLSAPSPLSSSSPGATAPNIDIPAEEVARIDRDNRVARAARRSPRWRPAE